MTSDFYLKEVLNLKKLYFPNTINAILNNILILKFQEKGVYLLRNFQTSEKCVLYF